MKVHPLGILKFTASTSTDVASYNLYGAAVPAPVDPANPPALDYDTNLLGNVPAPVAGTTDVTVDLNTIPGLTAAAATGQVYVFAVAAVDSAGNISDMSNLVEHPLDEQAPDAPTNLVWVDAA